MPMLHCGKAIRFAAAIIMIVALASGSAVAASESPLFDADDVSSFSVDDTQLFPLPSDRERIAEEPLDRTIPLAPEDAADPALNLVPLPASVVPTILGLSAVALHFTLRRRKSFTAGVFRRSR